MAKRQLCHTRYLLWVALVALFPVCLFAEEQHRFYHFEVGVQAGASYYVGELAPHVFMSSAEAYGAQMRIKINPRWAIQVKGQRQRVVNVLEDNNEWGVRAGRYQVPMWHMDVVGEYNFYQLGLDEYDIHMKSITPYIFLGVGGSVQNIYASNRVGEYPKMAKGTNKDFAMYIPLGIGMKWKFAERWQFQLAWQHNIYVMNGDGLEGVISKTKANKAQDALFNNSHGMNGSNIMNNDVTSTLTAGIVFEFGRKGKTCAYCLFD